MWEAASSLLCRCELSAASSLLCRCELSAATAATRLEHANLGGAWTIVLETTWAIVTHKISSRIHMRRYYIGDLHVWRSALAPLNRSHLHGLRERAPHKIPRNLSWLLKRRKLRVSSYRATKLSLPRSTPLLLSFIRMQLCVCSPSAPTHKKQASLAQTLDPDVAVFYTNRAMANRKLGLYQQVLTDSIRAAELESHNAKAHYLRGVATCEMAAANEDSGRIEALERGIGNIRRARELAERQGKPKRLLHEYTRATSVYHKQLWRLKLQAERMREVQYVSLLHSLLPAEVEPEQDAVDFASGITSASTPAASSVGGALAKVGHEEASLLRSIIALFEKREHARTEQEEAEAGGDVPDFATCGITMEPMLDPVVSSASGHSFERGAIERWLQTKAEDPITRKPLAAAQLTPNVSLRKAIDSYLEEHPWACPELQQT